MRSGKLAEQAGVNIETLRYYERLGLLPKPRRRASGYREYTDADGQRVRFIKRAQELGFTLKQITELLSLRAAPRESSLEVKRLTEEKIADLEARIRDLQRIRDTLRHISEACDGQAAIEECPILNALEAAALPCLTHHHSERSTDHETNNNAWDSRNELQSLREGRRKSPQVRAGR